MNSESINGIPSLPTSDKSKNGSCRNGLDIREETLREMEDATFDLPPPPSPEKLAETTQLDTVRLAGDMIDSVRHATSISHEKSQISVRVVIEMLQRSFGDESELSRHLGSLLGCLEIPSAISRVPELVANSVDAANLKNLFAVLTACKDDEQQRSWALHEDELEIEETLEQLHSILLTADHSISKYVMHENQYRGVQELALLYQMETRKFIRSKLRDVFSSVCKIDNDAIGILADSILPMELARELNECIVTDRPRVVQISKLLTILMSTGQLLPIGHYDHLGAEFISVVLKLIEDTAEAARDESLPNELTNFILAYNLQFQWTENNITVQALSGVHYAPFFSQRLINLLNWGKDPLDVEMPHGPPKTHSVFKLLIDIFSGEKATEIFFMNDIMVLVDIVIRWLTDVGPADERRELFLVLVRLILRNPCYSEHNHRKEDICDCLNRILQEEEPTSAASQRLIRDMYAEFSILNSDDENNDAVLR